MKLKSQKSIRILGLIVIAGCIGSGLTDAAGILLHPGYNPINDSVSGLAFGPFGWVQEIGLYMAGIAMLAFALGLLLIFRRPWEARLGVIFLFLTGTMLLLTAIVRTDPPGAPHTLMGNIHRGASVLAAIFFLPTPLLVSPAFRRHKKLFIYTIAAGITGIALDFGQGRLPANWSYFGLHERLIGTNVVLWILISSWILLVRYKK
jgi:hypothetical protein